MIFVLFQQDFQWLSWFKVNLKKGNGNDYNNAGWKTTEIQVETNHQILDFCKLNNHLSVFFSKHCCGPKTYFVGRFFLAYHPTSQYVTNM
jgi:hypothetical protein